MEKKFIAIMITLVVVLGFSNEGRSWKGGHHGGGSGNGYNFVDEDGDGICDNYNSGICPGYSDEDGDGICDNYKRNGCRGYVDEDSDGICDNRGVGRNFPEYGDKESRRGVPFINIFDGVPFTYAGEITRLGYFGSGTVITTEDGEETLYGLGPLWYWDCKEIPRLEVGDMIEVSGYTVEYNNIERNIVASITIGDETLELRDSETGVPLWKGGRRWICP
jgi:hypothetical protein